MSIMIKLEWSHSHITIAQVTQFIINSHPIEIALIFQDAVYYHHFIVWVLVQLDCCYHTWDVWLIAHLQLLRFKLASTPTNLLLLQKFRLAPILTLFTSQIGFLSNSHQSYLSKEGIESVIREYFIISIKDVQVVWIVILNLKHQIVSFIVEYSFQVLVIFFLEVGVLLGAENWCICCGWILALLWISTISKHHGIRLFRKELIIPDL